MVELKADDAGLLTTPKSGAAFGTKALLPAVICLQIIASLLVFASLFQPRPAALVPVAVATSRPARRLPANLPPPPVPPMVVMDIQPDTARSLNAAMPIDRSPLLPAAPFVFTGSKNDRANALTCLAAAEIYEAGDDKVGEQAVAQVVLNRARHPAFPKTICGVVFQGADRSIGCQFTFACDGSLARSIAPPAWQRAQALAEEALSGVVYKAVGTATHYHTDWVVPYWRASLDKIAMVHTHIFYRWKGWWGTPGAFSGRYLPPEQIDARLAKLSPADPIPMLAVAPETFVTFAGPMRTLPRNLVAEGVAPGDLRGNVIRLMDARTGQYVLLLDPAAYPGSFAIVAYALCKVRPACDVMGWTREEALPSVLPVSPAALPTMAFRFTKTGLTDRGAARWNCRQIRRDHPDQCLPGTAAPVIAALLSPPTQRASVGRTGSKGPPPPGP